MIGTTHFTNAVVQRRDLAQTAAVRLGLPATASLPPMVDWPEDLKRAIGGHTYLAHGGNEFDGRVISPLDEAELLGIAADIAAKGINTIAISSVFSPCEFRFREAGRRDLRRALPGAHITLSQRDRPHRPARARERGDHECLPARPQRPCDRGVPQGHRRDRHQGPFFLTQNDGTLMDAAFAEKFPVLTFASGPTNSMRGAAFLSGVQGRHRRRYRRHHLGCRLAAEGLSAPGHRGRRSGRRAHQFPHARRLLDRAGRRLARGRDGPGGIKVGPTSVGYRIITEALIFGGSTLTTSDVVGGCGPLRSGRPLEGRPHHARLHRPHPGPHHAMLEDCVERSRLSPEPLPVIVVGGGSILVDGPIGGLEVIKPNHFAVANAVGAAIAQVSGEIDRVYALAEISRDAGPGRCQGARHEAAVAAGRAATRIEIVDVEDVPLAYLPGNATRVRVKAVGELHVGRERCRYQEAHGKPTSQPLAVGAALLGTGGGGNPYVGMLRAREIFRKGAAIADLPLGVAARGCLGRRGRRHRRPGRRRREGRGRRRMPPRHAGRRGDRRRQDVGRDLGRDRRRQRHGAGDHRGAVSPACRWSTATAWAAPSPKCR
jgi:hypothetical protein